MLIPSKLEMETSSNKEILPSKRTPTTSKELYVLCVLK
jgi:hypothetical protein